MTRTVKALFPALALVALVFGSAGASFAAGDGGGCSYPYNFEHQFLPVNSPQTESAARQTCRDRLSLLPPHFQSNGDIVVRWVGSRPGHGEAAKFTCYACVANEIPDPFDENLIPRYDLDLVQGITITESFYGGEVTNATRVFMTLPEIDQPATTFIFTVNNAPEFDGETAVVTVDPETGQCIRLHPAGAFEK